jgi:hypothetical protein
MSGLTRKAKGQELQASGEFCFCLKDEAHQRRMFERDLMMAASLHYFESSPIRAIDETGSSPKANNKEGNRSDGRSLDHLIFLYWFYRS